MFNIEQHEVWCIKRDPRGPYPTYEAALEALRKHKPEPPAMVRYPVGWIAIPEDRVLERRAYNPSYDGKRHSKVPELTKVGTRREPPSHFYDSRGCYVSTRRLKPWSAT